MQEIHLIQEMHLINEVNLWRFRLTSSKQHNWDVAEKVPVLGKIFKSVRLMFRLIDDTSKKNIILANNDS